jgi:uncharacterized protein
MKVDLMDNAVVNALFETVPFELTVIDANDKVIAWNKHHTRLFHRPEACLEMDFRDCHPQKSLDLVEKIVSEFKTGTRDKARFWIDATVKDEKHKVLIEFYALRDIHGKYIGCMESSMDIEELRHLEGERRLMND